MMQRNFTINDPIDTCYSKGKNNNSYLPKVDEKLFGVTEEEKKEAREFLVSKGHLQYKD